jgi:hypothetical protein
LQSINLNTTRLLQNGRQGDIAQKADTKLELSIAIRNIFNDASTKIYVSICGVTYLLNNSGIVAAVNSGLVHSLCNATFYHTFACFRGCLSPVISCTQRRHFQDLFHYVLRVGNTSRYCRFSTFVLLCFRDFRNSSNCTEISTKFSRICNVFKSH